MVKKNVAIVLDNFPRVTHRTNSLLAEKHASSLSSTRNSNLCASTIPFMVKGLASNKSNNSPSPGRGSILIREQCPIAHVKPSSGEDQPSHWYGIALPANPNFKLKDGSPNDAGGIEFDLAIREAGSTTNILRALETFSNAFLAIVESARLTCCSRQALSRLLT
jgi:hypothetical protein